MRNFKASAFHPYAWWAFGLGLAISAAATSEIIGLLGIIALAVTVTLLAREASPWSRSLSFYLTMAAAVVVIRVLFRIIFNFDSQTNTAFTLPALTISLGELGNTQLFGRVSWDALFGALRDGLRMASILVSVGLANTLANPRQLLKNTPGALYEVASAWVIAINMAPQLIDSAKRVKRASRLRGRNKRHNLLGSMLIPVLEDTIERSLALAASMSARGFGRQGQLRNRQLLALRLASFIGVTCLAVGAYLLLTSPSPWMAAVLLAVGILGVGATSRVAALRQIRTRYQPTSWAVRDALLVATAVAIVCFALSGAI